MHLFDFFRKTRNMIILPIYYCIINATIVHIVLCNILNAKLRNLQRSYNFILLIIETIISKLTETSDILFDPDWMTQEERLVSTAHT